MATKKETKEAKTTKESMNTVKSTLDNMSVEELQAYINSRENGTAAPKKTKTGKSTDFSVLKAIKGKTVFIIGGTGFLGRLMLYYLLRYVPEIKHIYVMVRPTHGQSGNDRLHREVLNSPVFTTNAGDAEYFKEMFTKKVTAVEGDASKSDLGIDPDVRTKVQEKADIVLNTAGNVEFNPPLDMSIAANTMCTKNVLDFVENTRNKKYVHISTCYVADRTIHKESSPEIIVSNRVVTSEGTEILLDPENEIKNSLAAVERIRKESETEEAMDRCRVRAREELVKMGRDADSERLVTKIAKSIRTFELREKLIDEGKRRAARINRPNVYTYTKTLAELLVASRKDRIEYTIIRPSIVETTHSQPFPGWNEGIQGTAPLLFLAHNGHQFVPATPDNPNERQDAILDLIPVDEVAAGTVLALAALLKSCHSEIYQLAAGPLNPPLNGSKVLEASQIALRKVVREENTGLVRWLKLNSQARPVSKKTYERFSSPRMLKILSGAKERVDRMKTDNLPPAGARLVKRVQGNIDRFYGLSMLKTKIFNEFMPFMNHGYPIFQNRNAVELFKSLPASEKKLFHFNPDDIDYLDYLGTNHVPAIAKLIFPILDKRVNSINKAAKKDDPKGESEFNWEALRTLFSGDMADFRTQLRTIADATTRNIRSIRKTDYIAKTAEAVVNRDPLEYVEVHLKKLNESLEVPEFADADEEFLQKVANHFELTAGVQLTTDQLRRFKTADNLKNHIAGKENKAGKKSTLVSSNGRPFNLNLPREGLDVPDWAAKPFDEFCYNLQMGFYKNVMRVNLVGQENIPLNNNNLIIIANHSSHLDYGLVWYALGEYGRELGILAARDYFFSNFWNSTFFKNFHNLIPIERQENNNSYSAALVHAMSFMKKGGPLLIFPEGTRSEDGIIQPFKQGLGYLVEKTQADVLPIKLYGTHKALPKGANMPKSRNMGVTFGKTIAFDSLIADTENDSPTKTYYKITKKLEQSVKDLH